MPNDKLIRSHKSRKKSYCQNISEIFKNHDKVLAQTISKSNREVKDLETENLTTQVKRSFREKAEDSVRGKSDSNQNAAKKIRSAEEKQYFANLVGPNLTDSVDEIGLKKTYAENPKKKYRKRYDKKQKCVYCSNYYTKLARHLQSVHKNEIEVKNVLKLKKGSVERRRGFSKIAASGNHIHNLNEILHEGENLILKRQPTDQLKKFRKPESYLPCPDCNNWFVKETLYLHLKKCSIAASAAKLKRNVKRRQAQEEAKTVLRLAFNQNKTYISERFENEILRKMKPDSITDLARKDDLILKLGYEMFEQYDLKQADWIRQSMRLGARLLNELHKIDESDDCLSNYIRPKYFEGFVQAARLLGGEKRDGGMIKYEKASNATKSGTLIVKLAKTKRDEAILNENRKEARICTEFLQLYEEKWKRKVSGPAFRSERFKKSKKIEILPLTSDLLTIRNYIKKESKILLKNLKENCFLDGWETLAKLTLVRIIMFNRRRTGEAGRMTLDDFHENLTNHNEDSLLSLTRFEKKMIDRVKMIRISGKRGRPVSVLLIAEVVEIIEFLISTRKEMKIPKENQYVFPRVHYGSLGHQSGSSCLREVKKVLKNQLKNPDVITGTKMRKHMATIMQITDFSENDSDGIAKFLGHDIMTHRAFYRLEDDVFVTCKLSKILIAMEKGKISSIKGRKLEDIEISDLSESGNDSRDGESDSDLHSDLILENEINNENRPETSSKGNLKFETLKKKKNHEYREEEIFFRKAPKEINNNNTTSDENESESYGEASAPTSRIKPSRKRKRGNIRKILPIQMPAKEKDNSDLSSDESVYDFPDHVSKKIARRKPLNERRKFIKIPWSDRFDFMEKYFKKYIFIEPKKLSKKRKI